MKVLVKERESFRLRPIEQLMFEALAVRRSIDLGEQPDKSGVLKDAIKHLFESRFGTMTAGEIEKLIDNLKAK